MMRNPQIAILVNSTIFCSSLQCLLENAKIEVIGKARQWNDLHDLLKIIHPDLLLIDLLRNNESCIESLERLRVDYSEIPVILILGEECAVRLTDYIDMGITGFVSGDTPVEGLLKAIQSVSNGNEYFAEGILSMFKEKNKLLHNSFVIKHNHHKLTPREAAVCKLLCRGLSHKEIGATLYISPRTVETHKKNILAKLKAKSTADLVKYAMQNQLA